MKVLLFATCLLSGAVNAINFDTFNKYLTTNKTSSVECGTQKTHFLSALEEREEWAVKMLDAYGRIPEGITQGNVADLGMFDQCLNIMEKFQNGTIRGRYCFGGLIVPPIDTMPIPTRLDGTLPKLPTLQRKTSREEDTGEEKSEGTVFLLSACVPDACLPSDFFGDLGVDSICQTKNETTKLDAGDISFIVFLAIIILTVIASSIYDYYLQIQQKKPTHIILLALSAYTNGSKILKTTQQPGQILFFNGMKVLSMFWVIMGHRYATLEGLVLNKAEAEEWRRYWYAVYVLLAPLAVDTFLFVSGALLAYTFLKSMRKPDQKFNVFLYYLHRYLRLTPALAMVYFFQLTLARRMGSGPFYMQLFDQLNKPCYDNWWSLFLYVQNYVATDNMCMIHTWYLSVDMQLFIISPLILLPMVRYGKRVAYTVLPILVLLTITYTILIFYFYDIALWSDDYYNLFYYVTHGRFPPWLIGLIFGAFILDFQKDRQRYRIKSKLTILATWIAVLAVIGFLFFFQDDADNNHTRLKSTFFFPLQRPLWAVCLCWISFACLNGYAGFVNVFLSLPFFQILSKITYSTYLAHITVLMIQIAQMRTYPYFTDYEGIRNSIADICICYAFGALWTLAFESPIIIIEQSIFGKGKKEEGKRDANNNQVEQSKTSEPGPSAAESSHI